MRTNRRDCSAVRPRHYEHLVAVQRLDWRQSGSVARDGADHFELASALPPRSFRTSGAQVDYYDIKIENVIETIGADTILQECLTSDLFCNDIHRGAGGTLWLGPSGYVVDALANVGQLREKGVDVDLSYAFDMGAFGKLRSGFVGTWINMYEVTPIASNGGTAYNCAGYYGHGLQQHHLRRGYSGVPLASYPADDVVDTVGRHGRVP